MDKVADAQLLVKILLGVAWLDGQIQPEEREYLHQVISSHQLEANAEIRSLLAGTPKPTPTDCQVWIDRYLNERSIFDDDRLIEAISGLVYSDGDVAIAEAQLLNDIQSTSAANQVSPPNSLLLKIRQLYQNWTKQLNS